ncbi:MAG TPA: cytochrome c3 family protein [Bacillota bacterium]|nr:MAG: hypothetical protein BWY00_00484 [Firmicutes bacterium ADurb.Bin153]HNV34195.1 cytochrome c3 family protein [Bacillota bacterium]HPU95545.1 cytochrome c3 family protein [Bacillota bacterium]
MENEPHLAMLSCSDCHAGNPGGKDKAESHADLVERPSDDISTCAGCHPDEAEYYATSLHYTTAGFRNGVMGRFSEQELAKYDELVFEQSCRSCHAACGDCHVKTPIVSGVNLGLISGHDFVRKDETKTCALCHGGRVYSEFTGDYGGTPDVHYQKGMLCADCHTAEEMHGDGTLYEGRRDVSTRPQCVNCHPIEASSANSNDAHEAHVGVLSCSACHTSAEYRNCQNCHVGEGSTSFPALVLGNNPRIEGQVTTLRLVPTVRSTFEKAGIKQENFDSLPNWWDTVPHMTKKRTDRTKDCAVCHSEGRYFITEEMFPKDGSKANEGLLK